MNNAGVQADVHGTASKAHGWEIEKLVYGIWENRKADVYVLSSWRVSPDKSHFISSATLPQRGAA